MTVLTLLKTPMPFQPQLKAHTFFEGAISNLFCIQITVSDMAMLC